jgi:hypothetical protein
MTFRAPIIRAVGFDETLKCYAGAEDIDASYRASRHSVLLNALNIFGLTMQCVTGQNENAWQDCLSPDQYHIDQYWTCVGPLRATLPFTAQDIYIVSL